jgi:hypothetical protein
MNSSGQCASPPVTASSPPPPAVTPAPPAGPASGVSPVTVTKKAGVNKPHKKKMKKAIKRARKTRRRITPHFTG